MDHNRQDGALATPTTAAMNLDRDFRSFRGRSGLFVDQMCLDMMAVVSVHLVSPVSR
jgi:hypothetical protein